MDNKLMVPASIIIAAIVIAGALFVVNKGDSPKPTNNGDNSGDKKEVAANMKPISEDDHILGNPDAEVIIVEYSDTECPFCKRFHETMHQITDEYGKDGKVAWVYRHFPLAQLHPKAHTEAQATECAFDQGGNTAFWSYTDKVYDITPSNNGLDLKELPKIAGEIGLDVTKFEKCLADGNNKKKVDDSLADAFASGGRGTPHNIMIIKDGLGNEENIAVESIIAQLPKGTMTLSSDKKKIEMSGALPFELIDQVIQAIIGN
jgi:protein-disulfide isomerase